MCTQYIYLCVISYDISTMDIKDDHLILHKTKEFSNNQLYLRNINAIPSHKLMQ